jgi:hypothetical protein
MSAASLLFLVSRTLHVLLAAIWVGSTVFITFMLMPALENLGPTGGQVMQRMNKGGLNAFMGAIGGLTAVTGVYLLWRVSAAGGRTAMIFGIGGVAGLAATILGGAVVGRAAQTAVTLMEQIATTPDGPTKNALMLKVAAARGRMKSGGMVVLVLQIIALILMSIGHYV